MYLPEDGYNSWKNCKYFEPTKDAIKEKKDRVEKYINKTEQVKSTPLKQRNEPTKHVRKTVSVNVCSGDIVEHKAYGKGRVIKIYDNRIYISFNGQEKMFFFPDAFEKGYLRK